MKIDVHGSCVGYNLIKKDDEKGFQHQANEIESNLFFSHVNIAGSVLPALSVIPTERDFDGWDNPCCIRNMITDMSKTAISDLLQSEAEWLVIDFYDFARMQWACENSSYTHVAYMQIVASEYYKKIEHMIHGAFKWLDIPTFLWYPLIDQYFEQILPKYKDHIILSRVHFNQYYLTENGEIAEIPENQAYLGSYKDNEKIRRLEDYVITKYHLKEIDIAKYFFADYACTNDIFAVHYEEAYYSRGAIILKQIIEGDEVQPDLLDLRSLRYKVERSDKLLPEFRNAYFIKSPWHCDKLLDDLIVALTPQEQEQNKWTILKIYEWLESNKKILDESNLRDFEKQKILIDKFDEFSIHGLKK